MSDSQTSESSRQAQADLDTVTQYSEAGRRRGLYPRSFAWSMSLWAGLVTAAIGTGFLLPLMGLGIVAFLLYKQRRGVWAEEVESKGGLVLVVTIGLALGALGLTGAYVREAHDVAWATLAAGLVVAATLLVLTHLSYGRHWAAQESGARL